MRPPGTLRQALRHAVQALACERGGATCRDLAQRAQVPTQAARITLGNMARAGEVEPRGVERVEGSRRPLQRYVPVGHEPPGQALSAVVRCWPAGVQR